jgi:hypothetical protein
LLLSSILSPSLKNHLSSSEHFGDLVQFKLRYKVEWLVDFETEVFAESTGLNLISFVEIDDLPFLCLGSIVAPDLNWVSFDIFSSSNIKNLVVGPVDELVVFVLEDLEPS